MRIGTLTPAVAERIGIEPGRHPYLIHAIALLDPFLRNSIHLQHRVADFVLALIFVKDIPLSIDDLRRIWIGMAHAKNIDPVIVAHRRLFRGMRGSRAVHITVMHFNPFLIKRDHQIFG